MELALALAGAQLGKTGDNPAVGCVIVQGDKVVGLGATADGGRPHAEAVALSHAGSHAQGATVFVTLEPCAHVSARGQCCADALVQARISKLVCSIMDPDPRTAGKGFARLSASGIQVENGLLEPEGLEQIASFRPPLLGP